MVTSWILRLRFPLLPPESDGNVATGASDFGVSLVVAGAGSVVTLSIFTKDVELGEVASSSLAFLAALSGV